MAKNKTGLIVGIVAVIAVVAIVIGVVVANNNKGGNSGDTSQTSNTGLSAADLANIDTTIEYGDFDAMQTLSKAIQNGEMVGKVVKVDGLVSHPGTAYSIVQPSADGSKKIGTQFIIEGSEEYPKDGDKVVITGKIVEKDPMVFVIKTIPEMIVVK